MDLQLNAIVAEHISLIEDINANLSREIQTSVNWILEAIQKQKKILLAGNGGSAADAQHIAAEFVGRFQRNRRALPAIALTTDTSILTAIGNDFGFEKIFSRQVEALNSPGDIFLAISTSGNSQNLIEAVKVCKDSAVKSIGLLGSDGGKLRDWVDLPIIVKSQSTARVQEVHITIAHILCELIEMALDEEVNP